MKNLAKVIDEINKIKKENKAVVVAIDGRAASGKTTAAKSICDQLKYRAQVVHMDDFFLPMELRTAERFNMPGGNFHFERFKKEVMPFLKGCKGFQYRKFDCSIMDYGKDVTIDDFDVIVVEGAYSNHPILGEYADIKVFCDIKPEEQMRRIINRNGIKKAEMFKNRWIPLEEKYLKFYDIAQKAHIIL